MARRGCAVLFVAMMGLGFALQATGTLFGSTPVWIEFNPNLGVFDVLTFGFHIDW